MRKALVLLFCATVGCGQAQPVATQTAPSQSPASCRLPIAIADAGGNLQGAFVDYASGRVTIDPNGAGGAFYDRDFARWLPVDKSAVSPDGRRYARLDRKIAGTAAPQRLHVVDIATGGDQPHDLAPTGDPAGYAIISFASDGIWLSYAGYEGPRTGLFLFDLTTGHLNDVAGQRLILDAVSGGPGVFWYTDGGPNPQASGIGFVIPARLNRLTVADGTSAAWFTRDGSGVRVFGTDLAGHPIFGTSAQAGGFDVWIAGAPGEATKIAIPAGFYGVFAESRGVWFGGDQGIYLYSGADVRKVSAEKGSPAGTCA
ncbi:MAG TPA: hypothetical protein VJR46_00750 [Candidatus Dormibacteraeota bacterium]|nr:hypothetical protein [Candidatus Dormibacteraeota bacterium]